MARLLLIVNPVAGRGRGSRIAGAVRRTLEAAGHVVRAIETERRGQARELAGGDHAHWSDAVVSAGGDGTLNEVINGRGDLPLAVGIIPLGTGNVLAKELAIPHDPIAAAAVIARWQLHPIDLGQLATGQRWCCMVSAGIEGRIIELMEARRAGGAMKMWQYVPMAMQAVREADYGNVRVHLDGVQVASGISYAVVGNTHSFGGPIEITSAARCDDGKLDVVTSELPVSMSYTTMICLAFFNQLARLPGVRSRRASAVRIDSTAGRPVPYQVDGEYGGCLPIEMCVLPAALTVFAPEPASS